jgi:hypothetical protein
MRCVQLRSYHTEQGVKTALVLAGHKWLQVLLMDGKLKVRRVPVEEARHMSDVTRRGQPYPMQRALKVYRLHGRLHGDTKSARKFLRRASSQ